MRRLIVLVCVSAGLILLVLLGSLALIESEEVVRIRTRDPGGEAHTARVWIVDYGGRQWVAPGNRSNAWFQRLLEDPRIELARGGDYRCYVATVVESPESIPALEHFLDKYASVIRVTGLLNRLLEPGGDDTPPVAIRLDPCEG
jgi:hypothetical protein